jgi:hypothetical protein
MSAIKSRFVPKSIVVSVFAGLLIVACISILSPSPVKVRAEVTAVPLVTPTPCPTLSRTLYDFDNDCKADPSIWKQAESSFVVQMSGLNTTDTTQLAGHQRDRVVPADYDGDGKTDYAVFNDSSRIWHIVRSDNPQQPLVVNFGAPGDVPVPADFDGDGKADIAVWRPTSGYWYILKSSTGYAIFDSVQFGQRGDVPVVGDYDADGKADEAVWRPSDTMWYLLRSHDGFTGQQWGLNGDIPVPADYDGDKKTDVAIWRPSNGDWYALRSTNGTYAYLNWGLVDFQDVPVPADYDGDGKADFAYWRPKIATWNIFGSLSQTSYVVQLGAAGNTPVQTGGKCDVSKRSCWENSYNLNYSSSPTEWQIPNGKGSFEHQIEGYASKTSVNVNEQISFHVSTEPSQNFKIEIYRTGWYGGAGASLHNTSAILQGQQRTFSDANQITGLIEYDWPSSYSWTPPPGTVSGVFIAKLSTTPQNPANAKHSYIVFVVRDDARNSDFLFQTAVTTYQAYNNFPGGPIPAPNYPNGGWASGRSLYGQFSHGPLLPGYKPCTVQPCPTPAPDKQAREVSFNRPYYPDNINIYNSAGQFFEFEYNMVRWMEKEGYDVTYQTDIDTDEKPQNLNAGKHNTLLSVGHDEYWSWKMRDNVETARNRSNKPLNIGFFGANIAHWQIRFKEDSMGVPNYRTIVAYKKHYDDTDATIPNLVGDPKYKNSDAFDNHLITSLWRKNREPEITGCTPPQQGPECHCTAPNCPKRPEDELVGVMTKLDPITGDFNFIFNTDSPFPAPWIKNGIPGTVDFLPYLVGYEADTYFEENATGYNQYIPRDVKIISRSPITDCPLIPQVDPPCATYETNSVYYKLTGNQARVFASGSIRWSWGLDDFGQVPDATGHTWKTPQRDNVHAETLTRNVLSCFRYGGAACGEN